MNLKQYCIVFFSYLIFLLFSFIILFYFILYLYSFLFCIVLYFILLYYLIVFSFILLFYFIFFYIYNVFFILCCILFYFLCDDPLNFRAVLSQVSLTNHSATPPKYLNSNLTPFIRQLLTALTMYLSGPHFKMVSYQTPSTIRPMRREIPPNI